MVKELEHKPVLIKEVIDRVKIAKEGVVVDGTVGRGGHFLKIIEVKDTVVGLDYNRDSISNMVGKLQNLGFQKNENYLVKGNKKVFLKQANFTDVPDILTFLGIEKPSVIFLDLGVSMFQIKQSQVGISFTELDNDLDMRVDSTKTIKASDLLNALSQKELEELFKNLGEVRNYKYIASQVVNYRKNKKITKVGDFIEACDFKKVRGKSHSATKPFMALRIAVNSEHLNLSQFLKNIEQFLDKGTEVLILTFHSLEQSVVERFATEFGCSLCVVRPTEDEVDENISSRSALLNILNKKDD